MTKYCVKLPELVARMHPQGFSDLRYPDVRSLGPGSHVNDQTSELCKLKNTHRRRRRLVHVLTSRSSSRWPRVVVFRAYQSMEKKNLPTPTGAPVHGGALRAARRPLRHRSRRQPDLRRRPRRRPSLRPSTTVPSSTPTPPTSVSNPSTTQMSMRDPSSMRSSSPNEPKDRWEAADNDRAVVAWGTSYRSIGRQRPTTQHDRCGQQQPTSRSSTSAQSPLSVGLLMR
jgi:hypothetical protein